MADLLAITRQGVEVLGHFIPPDPGLEVTHQGVEVLGQIPPGLAITRHGVEILSLLPDGTFVSATNDLGLSQTTSRNIVANRSASNTLSFTDIAEVNRSFGCSASNTLGLDVQAVRMTAIPAQASSVLSLDSQTDCRLSKTVTATTPIYFNDTRLDRLTFDEIEIEHGVFASADVHVYAAPDPTGNILSLAQRAGVVHVRADAISVTASNTLSLSQWTNPTLTGDATSQLTLGHTASATASKVASNTLVLEQQATCTINRFVSARSTLNLHQAVSLTRIIGGTVSQYSPFVGSNTDPNTPEPPPTTLLGPMPGIEVPFQLVYPATGVVTDSVSLKTPNLGNKDRLAFRRVMRETRGGTLIVFADPIWPRIETLVLQFSGLLRVEAQNLLTFIEAHLGREVGLIDWEHRYWRGVITSPNEPIVEDRFDSFSASFEFEGTLDATWNPQVVPPTLRYSAIRSPQAGGYYVPNEPMPPVISEAIDYHAAEADSSIKIGQPVYLTSVGHVNPARASAAGTTQVAGVSISDVTAGHACRYLTEGRVERADWSEVAGTPLLSVGAAYFLDPLTAGSITTTAPITPGHFVVRIGRALSSNLLDVEIESPILL